MKVYKKKLILHNLNYKYFILHQIKNNKYKAVSINKNMFSRNKSQLPEPPKPPKTVEMIEDLKTFQVAKPLKNPVRYTNSQASAVDLKTWWQLFETFTNDIENMRTLESDIIGQKIKLETTKLGLETLVTLIKSEVNNDIKLKKYNIEHIKDEYDAFDVKKPKSPPPAPKTEQKYKSKNKKK